MSKVKMALLQLAERPLVAAFVLPWFVEVWTEFLGGLSSLDDAKGSVLTTLRGRGM